MHGMLPSQAALLGVLQSGCSIMLPWGLLLIPNADQLEITAIYNRKAIATFVLSSHGLTSLDRHPEVMAIWNQLNRDGDYAWEGAIADFADFAAAWANAGDGGDGGAIDG